MADVRARTPGLAFAAVASATIKIRLPVYLQQTYLLGDKHGNRN
jgi:hypothetical protein